MPGGAREEYSAKVLVEKAAALAGTRCGPTILKVRRRNPTPLRRRALLSFHPLSFGQRSRDNRYTTAARRPIPSHSSEAPHTRPSQ